MFKLCKATVTALAIGMASSWAMAQEANPVDVNTANAATLTQLPGIGEVKAQAIVQDRKTNGSYHTATDLTRVDGIGEGTVDDLKGQVTF